MISEIVKNAEKCVKVSASGIRILKPKSVKELKQRKVKTSCELKPSYIHFNIEVLPYIYTILALNCSITNGFQS